jgi:hypothetical protein
MSQTLGKNGFVFVRAFAQWPVMDYDAGRAWIASSPLPEWVRPRSGHFVVL